MIGICYWAVETRFRGRKHGEGPSPEEVQAVLRARGVRPSLSQLVPFAGLGCFYF